MASHCATTDSAISCRWSGPTLAFGVVDKVNASPGESILDVATGTAGVALALRAATGAEITGIDLNANMLETLDRS